MGKLASSKRVNANRINFQFTPAEKIALKLFQDKYKKVCITFTRNLTLISLDSEIL